jgi:hypothetical protein
MRAMRQQPVVWVNSAEAKERFVHDGLMCDAGKRSGGGGQALFVTHMSSFTVL